MKQKGKSVVAIILFIIAIVTSLLVINFYQLNCLASSLQEDAYVVASDEVSATLKSQKAPTDRKYKLTMVDDKESVYTRNGNYFIDQGKTKIDGSLPFYVNNANELLIINDGTKLITSEFEELDTYLGMYVSDGLSFNYDRTQADEDEIFFVKTKNNLHINAKSMTFNWVGGSRTVRMNSIFNFSKNFIGFYEPDSKNNLNYSQISNTNMLTVIIGEHEYSYEQFLILIGVEQGSVTPGKNEENEEEGDPAIKNPDETDGENSGVNGGSGNPSDGDNNQGSSSSSSGGSQTGGNTGENENPGSESGDPSQGGEGNNPGGGSEGGVTGEGGNGTSDNPGDEEGSESGEGTDPSDDIDDGEGDDPVEPPFRKPTVEFGEFVPDIYNVTTNITLIDPSNVFKRVVVELYWQKENADGTSKPDSDNIGDYQLNYRKTFKQIGDIKIDNLPPDTTIYARAILYYYDENGRTQHEVVYEGFDDRFRTLSLDNLDDVYLQFTSGPSDPDWLYSQHTISVFDFAISGPNKNVVDKISKIRFTLNALDENGEETSDIYILTMSVNDAKKYYYYPEDLTNIPVWTSNETAVYLPSNTQFNYKIDLLDPFGSPLTHIVDGYAENEVNQDEESSLMTNRRETGVYFTPTGSTMTAKRVPTVNITNRSFNDGIKNIDRAAYEISISDPDDALLGYEDTYYIRVFDEETNSYVQFRGSKDGELVDKLNLSDRSLSGNADRYEIWGLTAGHTYKVEIVGSYDLNDRFGAYNDMLLSNVRFSTVSLAAYGRVSYTFDHEHVFTNVQPDGSVTEELSKYESATAQKLYISIDYTQTLTELVDNYFYYLKFSLLDVERNRAILSGKITRQAMENITVRGTGSGEMVEFEVDKDALFGSDVTSTLSNSYRPAVLVKTLDFEGEFTLWDLFSNVDKNACLILYYEDGTLNPITEYRLDTNTFAYQGGEEHEVTSRAVGNRRVSFTTLKRMPYVTYQDALLVSDYIKFMGIEFHDPDKTIVNGVVSAGILGFDVNNEVVDYTNNTSGYISELVYRYLTSGRAYTFAIAPIRIQRDKAGAYVLNDETLAKYDFTAGTGLNGKIIFNSIMYPLKNKDGNIATDEDGNEIVELRSDYSLYNAGDFAVGTSSIDTTMYYKDTGDIKAGYIADKGNMASTNWVVSPLIQVKPGEYYYLTKLRASETEDSFIMFYDDYGKLRTVDIASWTTVPAQSSETGSYRNRLRVYGDNVLVKVPEGATQIRFAMYGAVNSTPRYATASCFAISKANGIEELSLDEDENATKLTILDANSENGGLGHKVNPGELYGVAGSYQTVTASFYDEGGTLVSSYNGATSGYVRTGQTFTVPAGASYVKVNLTGSTATYTNSNVATLVKINLDVLDWLNSQDLTKFANAIAVSVYDPLNNLVNNSDNIVYLDIKEDGVSLTGDNYPLSAETVAGMYLPKVMDSEGKIVTNNLTAYLCNFIGEANRNFELTLYVYYKGEKIVLDNVSFSTKRSMEVIDDRTDLAKLMRYKNGNFLVTNDITLRENEKFYFNPYEVKAEGFQGVLDFQGYTLKATAVSSSFRVMEIIGASATIKNLVFDITINNFGIKTDLQYVSPLAWANYGTVENIVVNLNLGQGMYRKYYSSALVYYNYGLINNFTLYYSPSSSNYVGGYWGGIAMSNPGKINNGLVYAPIGLNVTTGVYGGEVTASSSKNDYVGLVSAYSSGEVNNVLVIGSLAVEDYKTTGSLAYHSLISGSPSTAVHNCVTVGDIQKVVWNEDNSRSASLYTTYGPLLPGAARNNRSNYSYINNHFYSPAGVTYSQAIAVAQEKIQEAALLQDPTLYNTTVNLDGQFNINDIASGFYPRVIMPNGLINKQPKISLSSAGIDNSIRYLTASVDLQYEIGDPILDEDGNKKYDASGNLIVAQEDYAYVTLTFANRLERQINTVTIDGLTVTPIEGTTYEQGTVDGNYEVKVKVTPNNLYRKSYKISSFVYSDMYVADVTDREVVVKFSKPVNQDNWISSDGTTFMNDLKGCYRLIGDVDYSLYSASEKVYAQKAMISTSNFVGEFDGRGYSLKNFELTSNTYLIRQATQATIKDTVFDSFTIDASSTNATYVGIIGNTADTTELSGIIVKNLEIKGAFQYAGGLVGYASRTRFTDCALNGVAITAKDGCSSLQMGGLSGYATSSNVTNTFVRNLELTAKCSGTATGVGGLIGRSTSTNYVENVYTEGSIETDFENAGGIIGYNTGFLLECWSKVDVSSTAQYVGGLTGIEASGASISNAYIFGSVFTTATNNYNRGNGGFVGNEIKLVRTYAVDVQKIQSAVSTDLYDITGLMSQDDLKLPQVYHNTANIGDEFCYSYVGNGDIPILYYANKVDGNGERVLLPEQDTPIKIVDAQLEYTVDGTAIYDILGGYQSDDKSTWENAYDGYDLTINLHFTNEDLYSDYANSYAQYFGNNYENISIENLSLTTPVVTHEANGVTTLTFNNVTALLMADSYRVVINTDSGKMIGSLVFKDENDNDVILYRHIFRAERNPNLVNEEGLDLNSWVDAMAKYGLANENFMIMADLDFTNVNQMNLTTNLKINRLVGGDRYMSVPGSTAFVDFSDSRYVEFDKYTYLQKSLTVEDENQSGKERDNRYYMISGIKFQEDRNKKYLIYSIQGEFSHLQFDNISWKNTPTGNYAGLIYKVTGNVSYIDLTNINISYGNANGYVGFMVYTYGDMDFIRARDINVSTETASSKRTVSYVGGVSAVIYGASTHGHIRGTTSTVGTETVYNYQVNGDYTKTTSVGNYTGGFAGYMEEYSGYLLYSENVYVSGSNYVGSISGRVHLHSSSKATTYYNNAKTGLPAGEEYIQVYRASNVKVVGASYVGGIFGTGAYVYYGKTIDSNISGVNYIGGIMGSAGGSTFHVTGCTITASGSGAGGACGYGNDYGFGSSYITGCTISAEKYAAGLIGYASNTSPSNCVIRDCAIYANTYVGGIKSSHGGDPYNRSITNCIITNTYLGRSSNEYPEAYKDPSTASGYNVRWVAGSGVPSEYVGGIGGRIYGAALYRNIVDDSVEIKGSNYLGGIAGALGGGSSNYDMETAATITSTGNYVGGYAGILYGYATSTSGPNILLYPVTKVSRVIISGSVVGNGSVGAFIGSFNPGTRPVDPETGAPRPDEETGYSDVMLRSNFTQIVLAETEVHGTNLAQSGLIAANVKQSDEVGINYLRVYDGLKLGGTTVTALTTNNYLVSGTAFGSRWSTSDSNYSKLTFVDTNALQSAAFYYNTLANGGLYFSRYSGSNKANAAYYYYFDTAGTGDYTTDSGAGVLKTDNRFPYLTTGANRTRLLSAYQDGITIPGTTSSFSFMSLALFDDMIDTDSIFDAVSIYPSGVDRINIEVPSEALDYFEPTYSIISGNGNAIVQNVPLEDKVLTLSYNYLASSTFVLNLGSESQNYAITGENNKRDVMVHGSHAYYIMDDGIYMDNGLYSGTGSYDNANKVLSGSFVHLYQGKALDVNGNIYSLDTLTTVGNVASNYTKLSATPLYTSSYQGKTLETYRLYTRVNGGNEFDQVYRMFVKSGQLFSWDPSMDQTNGTGFNNFIADYYTSSSSAIEYFSALNSNNSIVDYKTAIKWPTDDSGRKIINNSMIKEVADNVTASVPYIIVRYADNTVACFNYETGSLLFVDESNKTDVPFTEYMSMWVSSYVSNLSMSNSYSSAKSVINSLTSNPVDDTIYGFGGSTVQPASTNSTGLETDNNNTTDLNIDGNGSTDSTTGDANNGTAVDNGSGEGTSSGVANTQTQESDNTDAKTENSSTGVDVNNVPQAQTTVYPPATSESAYITMVTKENEQYSIFKVQDLLEKKGNNLYSENEKIEFLKRDGIYQGIDISSLKIKNTINLLGIILIATTVMAITTLIVVLSRKKYRANK